jgi:tetratricopeptide (TPR) repeat protein
MRAVGIFFRDALRSCLPALASLCFAAAAVANEKIPKPPPRTVLDIAALLGQFKPDPLKLESARARLKQPPPDGADDSTLARFYFERARAADELGDARQRLENFRKAREFARDAIEVWWVLDGLSSSEAMVGNLRNAIEIRNRRRGLRAVPHALFTITRDWWGDHVMLGDLVSANQELRNLEQAYATLTGGHTSGWFKDTYLSRVEQGRAHVSLATGKYAQAEAQFHKSIVALEDYIDLTPRIPVSAGRSGATSGLKQRREGLLIWLSRVQVARGRYFDAEVTLREALKSALSERGPNDALAQSIVINLSSLLSDIGRFPRERGGVEQCPCQY